MSKVVIINLQAATISSELMFNDFPACTALYCYSGVRLENLSISCHLECQKRLLNGSPKSNIQYLEKIVNMIFVVCLELFSDLFKSTVWILYFRISNWLCSINVLFRPLTFYVKTGQHRTGKGGRFCSWRKRISIEFRKI